MLAIGKPFADSGIADSEFAVPVCGPGAAGSEISVKVGVRYFNPSAH